MKKIKGTDLKVGDRIQFSSNPNDIDGEVAAITKTDIFICFKENEKRFIGSWELTSNYREKLCIDKKYKFAYCINHGCDVFLRSRKETPSSFPIIALASIIGLAALSQGNNNERNKKLSHWSKS
jgi:hypothetical protein